jgi:hypothetical protein
MKQQTTYARSSGKVTQRQKRRRKKIVPIPETKPSPDFGAGSHKLRALQKHVGIVKPKTARKMESIEKWIKRRNRGEI